MKPNDQPPNYRNDEGYLCIVRCFVCEPEHGRENWAPAVAQGYCSWCGWTEGNQGNLELDDNGNRLDGN